MTMLVTGATGALGRLVVDHLLDMVPAEEFAVSVRDPGKAADLVDRGIDVRKADFDDPASLDAAFAGVRGLLVISTDGPDDVRITQHANAVDAAVRAGVQQVTYTSVVDAQTSPLQLARTHRKTELRIRASGIPFTFLRNGLYHEHYAEALSQALTHGALISSTGTGRTASVSRDDLARAAATVLSEPGHDGAVYELTGPRAWSFDELAQLATVHTGKPLVHTNVSDEEFTTMLSRACLPGFVVDRLVDINANTRAGVLAEVRPDLERLIGRAPSGIEHAVARALPRGAPGGPSGEEGFGGPGGHHPAG